jgi:hypothetical protein
MTQAPGKKTCSNWWSKYYTNFKHILRTRISFLIKIGILKEVNTTKVPFVNLDFKIDLFSYVKNSHNTVQDKNID